MCPSILMNITVTSCFTPNATFRTRVPVCSSNLSFLPPSPPFLPPLSMCRSEHVVSIGAICFLSSVPSIGFVGKNCRAEYQRGTCPGIGTRKTAGNRNKEELGRMRSPWQYLLLAIAIIAISDPRVIAERFRLRPRQDPTVTPTPLTATSADATQKSHAATSDSDSSIILRASTADSSAAPHTSQTKASSSEAARETSGSVSISSTIPASLVASSPASSASNHGMNTLDNPRNCGLQTKSGR